jgi:hypothetical protein
MVVYWKAQSTLGEGGGSVGLIFGAWERDIITPALKDTRDWLKNFFFQLKHSNSTQVTLKNVDFDASATYYCEVTIDNPIFTKASKDEHIHVIGMWWINSIRPLLEGSSTFTR